jgi:hypothetical protein
MEKYNPNHSAARCHAARRSVRLRVIFGSKVLSRIPQKGFALAASLHSVLFAHVTIPEPNERVLTRATEILAQLGQEWPFSESGNALNDRLVSAGL